jgi:hypothetical protein
MKLTEREKTLIARRAAGEYAIIPAVERIVRDHKKNRNPDDQVFLDYARWALTAKWNAKDYERLATAVLAIIPEPFGPPWWKRIDETPAPTLTKRKRKCGLCGQPGHNARTCPDKTSGPTMTYSDGNERLTPGFDPNPPVADDAPPE